MFNPITDEEIKAKMEENVFVRSSKSYYASQGDPCVDLCSNFNIARYTDIEELKKAFMMYDAHRQTFVYKSLVFVNSTLGGGWEAWTLKKFGAELIAFESISMQLVIERGEQDGEPFEAYIKKLLKATKEQCLKLSY